MNNKKTKLWEVVVGLLGIGFTLIFFQLTYNIIFV